MSRSSTNTAVAAYVDSQRTAQGLILQSGIASLPNVARNGISLFCLYPDFIWPGPILNNCALLAKSKTSLLLLHGNKGKLVPISNSALLFASAMAPAKRFIKLPDCGHNDVGFLDNALYQKTISQYVCGLSVTNP